MLDDTLCWYDPTLSNNGTLTLYCLCKLLPLITLLKLSQCRMLFHFNISRGPGLVTPASLFSSSLKRKEYLRLGVTYPKHISGQQQAGIKPSPFCLFVNLNNFFCYAFVIEKHSDLYSRVIFFLYFIIWLKMHFFKRVGTLIQFHNGSSDVSVFKHAVVPKYVYSIATVLIGQA